MVRTFFIGSLFLTASSSCLFSSLWTCCYRTLRNRLKSCMQQMSSTSSLLMLLFPLASFSTSESIFFPLHLELILYALTAKLFAVGVNHHICPSLKLNTLTELVQPTIASNGPWARRESSGNRELQFAWADTKLKWSSTNGDKLQIIQHSGKSDNNHCSCQHVADF